MEWNYAELSRAAKRAGGPEKYVTNLATSAMAAGKYQGRVQMLPWVGAAFAGGGLLGFVINHFISKRKQAKLARMQDDAKQLIDGINTYNASQSNKSQP